MMDDQLYRVVFDGTLTGEFDDTTTRRRFSKVFKTDPKTTDRLFNGKEHVLKSNISETEATTYLIKLLEIGCECYMEGVDDALPKGIAEKRRNDERRMRLRRGPRAGAIIPDRRLLLRRKYDRKYFVELKQRKHPIPDAFKSYSLDSVVKQLD